MFPTVIKYKASCIHKDVEYLHTNISLMCPTVMKFEASCIHEVKDKGEDKKYIYKIFIILF